MQLNLDGILFDEKPLDIYLRHGFPSEIADRDLEMFGACDYSRPHPSIASTHSWGHPSSGR